MQGSSDKEWLIKSAGEIKGPYTFDEIAAGLQSKEFIVVDEIAKKFSRWKYIRDEEIFFKVIIELKNREESKSEKTLTSSQTDSMTEDIDDKVVSFSAKSQLTSQIEEQIKRSEISATPISQEESEEKKKKIKKFVSAKELKKNSRISTVVQIVLIIAIMCLIGLYLLQEKKEPTWSYEDLKQQVNVKANYGEFDKVKYYAEKALTLNNQDENLNYLYAYASLQLDDNATAQKILIMMQTKALKPDIQVLTNNLLGVIQLKNFNLKEAHEFFQKAIDANSQFVQAIYNRGVTSYLENDYDKSLDDFQLALTKNGWDGVVLLSLAENLTHNYHDNLSDEAVKKKFTDLKSDIENIVGHITAYKQELMVALAYVNFNLGDKDEMSKWVTQALMMDPQQTTDHILDASYYRGLITWDRIADWALQMRDANPENVDLKTLYGYAQFKGSDKLKGKDIIEGLLRSDYTNVPNQILHAYTLWNLNRDQDAKAALQPVMQDTKQTLSFYLMGLICLKQNDLACALTNFQQTLKNDSKFEGALAGLAQVFILQKDYAKAHETISREMLVSPTYKPILLLKEQLEGRAQ